MNEKVKKVLTELNRQLERLYGERLVRMVLYGSHARGDAEAGSDIDVLVVLKGDVNPGEEIKRTSEIVAGLSLEYNEVISCAFMDEERFLNRQGPFLRNIRKEGVPL